MKKLALALALLASGSLSSSCVIAMGNRGCAADCQEACCVTKECTDPNCSATAPCASCEEKMSKAAAK